MRIVGDAAQREQPVPREAHRSQERLAARKVAVLHEVVITGLGVILPNCDDASVFWRHLKEGECQLSIEPDPGDEIACAIGRVRDFDGQKYLAEIAPNFWRGCSKEQL